MSRPLEELVADLKASYPPLQEAIPGLKRKSDKEYCGACPNPGCKVDNDGFLVFPKTQKFWCRGCECHGDIIEYYRMTGNGTMMQQLETAGLLEDRKEASRSAGPARAKGKDNLPAYIWGQSKSGADAAAIIQKAFAFRSIQLEQIPPNIRLNSYKGQLSIACAMQSPLGENPPAKPQCVHLTLLDDAGRKCGTRYQGPKKGLVVLLPGDRSRLVIGEGLETTLSAMQAMGYSGMVCGDAGNMAGISRLPEKYQEIFLLTDSDSSHAGQKAALDAAESIGKANPQAAVYLVAPDDSCFTDSPKKLDFNDLLKQDTSGSSIRARFAKKQRLDEIGWRPKEQEQPNAAEPDKKSAEVWSFADVEQILEQNPELLKWMVCAPDQEMTTIQKHGLAEEILLHNSFRPAELHAVKEMLKKKLGIAKGEQDKILKAARKKKHNGGWFLTEEDEKGLLRLIAQNRAAEKISEMVYDKYMFAPDIQHWHSFTGTHWADDRKDDNFGSHLVDVLGDGAGDVGFNAGYMTGVESIMIRSGKHKPAAENGKTRVPFQNGVLYPETGLFEQTTPDNALRWCLPYKYDPDAECELWDVWLDMVCDDDTGGLQNLIMASINVCLMERPDLQFFIHLQGEPGTGKGTLARLLKEIVGPQGFWKSDIELLEEDKFEPANYYQKRLLQFDEVPAHVKRIRNFLSLTGRDPVRFEEKNKQADQHFIFTGLVLLLGNSMFSTDDQTTFAIERRRRTVQFNRELSESDRRDFADAGGEKLLHEEIPGIINKALRMSREQVSEVFYKPPVKVTEANMAAEEIGSPVVKFITEHVQYDPAGKVYPGVKRPYMENGREHFEGQEDKLYPRYLAWCSRMGKRNLERGRFIETAIRAVNRRLVPEGYPPVETGNPDKKGTPIIRLSLVSWVETEFNG